MDWLQVFVNTIITGILLYVFQRVIDERSSRRLEEYKSQLQSVAFEWETKFSKLHETRAEVVAELYKRLYLLQRALASIALFVDDVEMYYVVKDIKLGEIEEADEDFWQFFQANKLLLPKDLCEQIVSFNKRLDVAKKVLWDMSLDAALLKSPSRGDENRDESYKQSMEKVLPILREEIPPLLTQLEDQFRKLLGS